MTVKNEPYAGTQAVVRAISLLEAFTDQHPEWDLVDLTKAVGLNRTTGYRLLTALENFDMVVRNPETDRYRLGSGVITLGGRAIRANPVRTVSRPELEQLAALTGEMSTLEILSGHEVVVIDAVSVDRLISGSQSIGTRWPAGATSTGKAIMAYLSEAAVAEVLQTPVPQLTPKTITAPEQLHQCLAQIRDNGFAISIEALELGVIDIGASIRNYDDQPIAAISVTGPAVRLTESRLPQIGLNVRETALRISTQLGWRS